jgi:hypothetical protein
MNEAMLNRVGDLRQLCSECNERKRRGHIGTGYYHGQWFCEDCWNAWRTHTMRPGREAGYEEQHNNEAASDEVQEPVALLQWGHDDHGHEWRYDDQQVYRNLSCMVSILWARLDQVASQQGEMQRTVTRDLRLLWQLLNRTGQGGWYGWYAENQNNWNTR